MIQIRSRAGNHTWGNTTKLTYYSIITNCKYVFLFIWKISTCKYFLMQIKMKEYFLLNSLKQNKKSFNFFFLLDLIFFIHKFNSFNYFKISIYLVWSNFQLEVHAWQCSLFCPFHLKKKKKNFKTISQKNNILFSKNIAFWEADWT